MKASLTPLVYLSLENSNHQNKLTEWQLMSQNSMYKPNFLSSSSTSCCIQCQVSPPEAVCCHCHTAAVAQSLASEENSLAKSRFFNKGAVAEGLYIQ